MPKKSPGARDKGIGAQLRALREESHLTVRAAASAVGWDKGRLSRIETGNQTITIEDVAALLPILGVTGERREQMLAQVRNDEPGWWEKTLVTKETGLLADYESHATEMVSWAPLIIPGLLQTSDYAYAFMELYNISPDDIGLRLGARIQRQRAAAGKPYTAYIGESAVRTLVGDRRIMAAQLAALVDRDDVVVRVVPAAAAKAHLGQVGAFLLLRLPADLTIVHVELLKSGIFLDDPQLTSPYETAVTQVDSVALGETESVSLIGTARREMEA